MNLIIADNADALAAQAADFIADAARTAVQERGRFSLCMTGGATPEQTYEQLAGRDLPWDVMDFFWGDERFVPFDDPRSNFGMAQRSLLSRAPVPAGNLFPMPTDAASAAEGARLYAQTLGGSFGIDPPMPPAPPPVFDLLLLGLGDDGHCASLFPGHPTLHVTDAWAISSPPGTLPPPVERITLTFPVLNASRQVLFLVAGAKKAEAVADILEGGAQVDKRPAAGVKPESGTLTWLIDEAAASRLEKRA